MAMDNSLKKALKKNAQEILSILSANGVDVSNYEKILTETPKPKREHKEPTTPEEIAQREKRREYGRTYREKKKRLAIEAEEERKRWQERQEELERGKALAPSLDVLNGVIWGEERRINAEINRELSPLYELLQFATPIQKRVNKRREREEERKRQEVNKLSGSNALIQTAEEIKPTIEDKKEETPPTLKDLRKNKGLSAQAVANKLNVSRYYLFIIESGQLLYNTTLYSRLARIYQVREQEIYKRLLPFIIRKSPEELAHYISRRIRGKTYERTGKRQDI